MCPAFGVLLLLLFVGCVHVRYHLEVEHRTETMVKVKNK